MHDVRKEEYGWESTVRLMVGREDELGMYLEESREGRKRKWQPEKMRRDGSEDKDQKKVPPKKIMGEFFDIAIYLGSLSCM